MSGGESAGGAAAVLQIIRPAGTTFAATGFPLPQLIQLLHKSPLRHSCTMGVKRSKLRCIHVDTHTHMHTPRRYKEVEEAHTLQRHIKDLTDRHLAQQSIHFSCKSTTKKVLPLLLAGRRKIVMILIMTPPKKNEIRAIAHRLHIWGHHYLDGSVDSSCIMEEHEGWALANPNGPYPLSIDIWSYTLFIWTISQLISAPFSCIRGPAEIAVNPVSNCFLELIFRALDF